ncbi:sugar transferase [Nonomuraea sp. NPDC050536]|uniref:sugar transferase n=1 Tax=Nonomuraea sp. NPDC050536 TaxID=3364366 RepID=UPI0037CB4BE7
MTASVGTSDPAVGGLDADTPVASARPVGALHRLAATSLRLLGVSACLAAATAVWGTPVTDVAVATLIAVVVYAVSGAGRPGLPIWTAASRHLCVGLISLAIEATVMGRPVDGDTWLAAGATYAVLASLLASLVRAVARGGKRRAVIAGEGEHGRRLARALFDHPEYRIVPVGFAGDSAGACARAVRRSQADLVILAGRLPASRAWLQRIAGTGCRVLYAPVPEDPILDFVPVDRHIRGFPLLPLTPPAQRRPYWGLKRMLDVVVALSALTLASPVLVLCLLAARLEGGPGVLFRQRRIGQDGGGFEILKIRTLTATTAHDAATQWKVGRSRFTGPVGAFLRKTSLDELPQLWNVVQGHMSIVGPRPERPFFVHQFSQSVAHYDRRHRLPVGITGWAQVHGLRGDTSIEDRARFDNHYIDAWSIGLDLKIIVRTIACVLRLKGA